MNATENEHDDQREQATTPDPKTSNMLFGVIAVALVAAIVSIAILSLDREPTNNNQPLPAPSQPSTPELPNDAAIDTSSSISGTIPVVLQTLLPRTFENLGLNIEDDDAEECVDYDCTEYLEFAYWSSADYSLSFSGVALKGVTLDTFISLMVGDLPLAPLSLTHGVVGKAGLDGQEYVLFFASHGYVVGLSCDYVKCRTGMTDFAHFLITRMYEKSEGAATIPTDHPISTATVIEPSVQASVGEVSANTPERWTPYQNAEFGLTFSYPPEYTVTTPTDAPTKFGVLNADTSGGFFCTHVVSAIADDLGFASTANGPGLRIYACSYAGRPSSLEEFSRLHPNTTTGAHIQTKNLGATIFTEFFYPATGTRILRTFVDGLVYSVEFVRENVDEQRMWEVARTIAFASDIPTPIPPKDVVFATYGNVSSGPRIRSTIIDATAIHPSDMLPRTVTLGDTSFTITDITFTNSPADSAPEGNVSLSLTTDYLHPTGAPERIVYLYRHDVAWQEGYGCTTGTLCGSGSPSSLYHTHNTERPATLEEVMRAYPNLPEATLTQWTTVGYTLYTRYNIKVHSFEYSRTTGAWNSIKLILERQEEVMPPNEPT